MVKTGRIRSYQGQKLRASPGRRNHKLEGLKVKISPDRGIQYKGSEVRRNNTQIEPLKKKKLLFKVMGIAGGRFQAGAWNAFWHP